VAQPTGGFVDAYGGINYLATMVGYFPADNPKYSCIVSIETYFGRGSYGTYYGSSLAGPVFKAVADRVNAAEWSWQPSVAKAAGTKSDAPIPIKGGRVQDIRNSANRFSVALRGDVRRDQWATVSRDSTGLTMIAVNTDGDVIPNVVGMGLREAVYLMENCGLNVNFSGRGRVVSQSLRAGDPPVRGATVTLRLDS
jgi:cell division protein FtsI (penicillin-binding protein 3)